MANSHGNGEEVTIVNDVDDAEALQTVKIKRTSAKFTPAETKEIIDTFERHRLSGHSRADAIKMTAVEIDRDIQSIRRTIKSRATQITGSIKAPHETPEYYTKLKTYCKTTLEEQIIATIAVTATISEAAESLDITRSSVQNKFLTIKARAALRGYAPEYGHVHEAPPTHFVKGTSTLYKDGESVLQWVKTDKKSEDAAAQLRILVDALKEDVPSAPIIAPDYADYKQDRMVVIPFGDPHIGMLADPNECGDAFDLKIAERDTCAAVDELLAATPPSAECLIVNLGDLFHADSMDATTWRSGHRLDVDSRWSKMLRVGVRIMRYCIEAAARRHEKVTVINAIGNHDDHSSMFLSVVLSQVYEDNPRINIIDTPTALHFYRFGQVLIAVHHGHGIKMQDLPLVTATERPEDWGATKFRYGLTGHIHHDSKKEFNGMTVESFRTLAARDAWAASKGYKSLRDMKSLVMHREFGEIGRHTVSVEMLNALSA